MLRLIRDAAAGGAKRGTAVAVCGGLASEIAAAPILIGLGVTELSAAPAAIPELKAAIRDADHDANAATSPSGRWSARPPPRCAAWRWRWRRAAAKMGAMP